MNVKKEEMAELIRSFIGEYQRRSDITTEWGDPLVGFADANHADMAKLKQAVGQHHWLPSDLLPDATVILSYFVPLTEELAETNRGMGEIASPEWAVAYEETNTMFEALNDHLIEQMEAMGYRGVLAPKTRPEDAENLISNWSQRHIARLAGLGTFGINHMLITKAGCCGRYGSVITNLSAKPDAPVTEEYCFYKQDGSCGVCLAYCPAHALEPDSYDRYACNEVLLKNAMLYGEEDTSYNGPSPEFHRIGGDVCGKCITNAPCAFLSLK